MMEETVKPKKVYVQKFKDGRPPIHHNHPFSFVKGKRPRPPGPLKRLVTRKEWKAIAPEYGENLKKLDLPVNYIRYYDTKSDICVDFKTSCEYLRDVQWGNMKDGFPDIRYSFYVASDGAVYEGRGWNYVTDFPEEEVVNVPRTKIVDIAFIGDYSKKRLPGNMKNAALDLIDWGVYHFKVNCCHEIVPIKTEEKKIVSKRKDEDLSIEVKPSEE